jgi:hypothetical protein
MEPNFDVKQLQDLGDATVKVRPADDVGARGVTRLIPDDDGNHLNALEEIREVLDEHYGERIEEIANDGTEVVVERVVLPADDLPYIEYRLVDEV